MANDSFFQTCIACRACCVNYAWKCVSTALLQNYFAVNNVALLIVSQQRIVGQLKHNLIATVNGMIQTF